jgi:F-type H+-transporting ATPase subunit delta
MSAQPHAKGPSDVPANIGAQQIATVYAKALLGSTEKAGQTAAILAELDALVADVLDRYPRLEAVLHSALIRTEEKNAIIERVFAGRVSPLLVRFLKVLADHGRLDVLRAVHQEMRSRYDVMQGRVRVRVSTAEAVNGQVTGNLLKTLRGMLGGEPQIESEVNPELIGGLVLRIGDTVYDGSVARQLGQVREQMINRSVHEIQSRRDRFRHSGGN